MQNNRRELLYQMIRSGKFSDAASYTGQHIKEHQNEEYFVLFYILFRIWEEEQQTDFPDFFSSPLGHEPDTLLEHYTQIKLYLRRFEYHMADDILKESMDYFTAYQVSPYALYRIAQFACIKPYIAFRELARMYETMGQQKIAAIFRQTSESDI